MFFGQCWGLFWRVPGEPADLLVPIWRLHRRLVGTCVLSLGEQLGPWRGEAPLPGRDRMRVNTETGWPAQRPSCLPGQPRRHQRLELRRDPRLFRSAASLSAAVEGTCPSLRSGSGDLRMTHAGRRVRLMKSPIARSRDRRRASARPHPATVTQVAFVAVTVRRDPTIARQ